MSHKRYPEQVKIEAVKQVTRVLKFCVTLKITDRYGHLVALQNGWIAGTALNFNFGSNVTRTLAPSIYRRRAIICLP